MVRNERRSRKKQRTRRQIFDAAMTLSEQRDFDAVTVEEICESADVARGTFFLHFPSKTALLTELDRELAVELAGRLPEPRGSAAGEYRMLVATLGARWRGSPGLARALLPVLLSGGGALAELLEGVVRRGQRRGELRRVVSPRFAAIAFLTTTAAAFGGSADSEGEPGAQEVQDTLLHTLLHGLHEPKPRLKWKPPRRAPAAAEAE